MICNLLQRAKSKIPNPIQAGIDLGYSLRIVKANKINEKLSQKGIKWGKRTRSPTGAKNENRSDSATPNKPPWMLDSPQIAASSTELTVGDALA